MQPFQFLPWEDEYCNAFHLSFSIIHFCMLVNPITYLGLHLPINLTITLTITQTCILQRPFNVWTCLYFLEPMINAYVSTILWSFMQDSTLATVLWWIIRFYVVVENLGVLCIIVLSHLFDKSQDQGLVTWREFKWRPRTSNQKLAVNVHIIWKPFVYKHFHSGNGVCTSSASNPDARKHFCTYPGNLSFINTNSSGWSNIQI